jgi:hypothetical protein
VRRELSFLFPLLSFLFEVVKMTPQLQEFIKRDSGFEQYCEQYKRVAADPETRAEYYRWVDDVMHQEGVIQWARDEGKQLGIEIGIEASARNFLTMGLAPEQVAQGTGLPLAKVKELMAP